MRKKDTGEEKGCFYCEHSTPIMDTDACVCDIRGVVKGEGLCKKYKLDLLKVKPRQPRVFEGEETELFGF